MVALYNFKLAFAAAAEKYAIEIAAAQQASKVQMGSLCPTVDYRVMSTAFGVDAAVSAGVGMGFAVAGVGVGVIMPITGAATLPSLANSLTAN